VSVIKAFFGLGKLPQVVKYFEFQSFQDVNKMGGALRAIREEAKTSGAQLTKNQQKYLDDQQRQVEMVFEQLQQPTTQTGIRGTQSAKIIDMQGKEIPKGSKIMGGKAIDDTKMIDDAIENSSPGFAKGDTKYNAELVAEDLAERMGLVYDDLDTKQKIDIYGKAYDRLSKRNFQVKEFEKRIAEKLGAQNKQSVGNLRKKKLREDISKLDDKIEARKLQLEQRGVEDFETDDLFNKLDEQRNDLSIKLDFEDMVGPTIKKDKSRADEIMDDMKEIDDPEDMA
jgi:vacuolar-type H+-ATPase subunit I/STV1